MALTTEQWDALQERALNPFRSNESNAVNRLTRTLTLGDDVVLEEEKCLKVDRKTVKVLATHYIKDDVYIHFDEDVDLDFTDVDNYLSTTDRGMDRAGTYFVVMHYVYSESIPFPIARFKILKNAIELTPACILLCNARVELNEDTGLFDISHITFEGVPLLVVKMLRTGDFINIPFERISGLAIEALQTATNKVYFNGGRIIDKAQQIARFLQPSEIGPFAPVSGPSLKRYDLITIDFSGVLHVYPGTEYASIAAVDGCLMALPYDEYPLAYVEILSHNVVTIFTRNIIDVRDFLNTSKDLRPEIVSLLDFCSHLNNKHEELKHKVEVLEATLTYQQGLLSARVDVLEQ